MSATFKRVLLGKDVSFTVIPLSITAGVISEVTSLALTGRSGEANVVYRYISGEVTAMDGEIENNVSYRKTWQLELSEVTHETADNPLQEAADNGPEVAVIIATPTESRKYWGTIQEWNGPIQPVGNRDRLTLIPFDTGEDNPTVTAI